MFKASMGSLLCANGSDYSYSLGKSKSELGTGLASSEKLLTFIG